MKINVTDKQCARALFEALEDQDTEQKSNILKKLIAFLYTHNKLKKIDNIINEYVLYAQKMEGIAQVDVVSARELDITLLEKLKSFFGVEVDMRKAINPDLIGGVVIRKENTIYDASIKTQLQKLRKSILS